MADDTQKHYVSEDELAGYAAPVLDIIAALALGALSIWIMIEALRLKVPDTTATAPGLLPFLTAAMLLAMAIVLGVVAVRRQRTAPTSWTRDLPPDLGRTGVLVAIVIAYIAALQLIHLDRAFTIGRLRIEIGSFEPVSIIVLATIFRIFWTSRLWACVLLSAVWIMLLSIVFRQVMNIPMPG